MATFIGNSNDYMNWPKLIEILENTPPRLRGNEQDDDIHIDNPKVLQLIEIWKHAGIADSPTTRWIDFLPDDQFPVEWVTKFAEWLDVEPAGAWVSAVPPGYLVPWHPDYKDPQEEDYLMSKGRPTHFTVYICEPSFGQVSIVDSCAIYNATQGDVWEWDDWQDWHGGLNMGLKTKYMFNFFGWKDENKILL